ncbi:MAG: hypothetical protein V4621_06330 [Pseudomonadota bacterium]
MKQMIALSVLALTLTACHCQDTGRVTRDMYGYRTYSTPALNAKMDAIQQSQRAGPAPAKPGVTIYPLR